MRHVSGITFIKYVQSRNIGEPNNLKDFGNEKTKAPKQDRQNQLWSANNILKNASKIITVLVSL